MGVKRPRCATCAPEVREAARLLSKILKRATVVNEQGGTILFNFQADLELHDRLCIWGAADEDREDDAPLEECGELEDCMHD